MMHPRIRNLWLIVMLSAVSILWLCGGAFGQTVGALQAAAERAVGKQSACVIAIDPRSGQILAMVNEKMACRKSYPPGSVIKLLTAYAGLESGLVTPDTVVDCRNAYKAGDTVLRCSLAGGHGNTNLRQAIARSCNVYFYKMGEKLGPGRLLRCFKEFGLGSKCGDYISGQEPGSIPKRLSGRSSIAGAAIGQADGLRVTALQMAVITSAIANGGTVYAPKLNQSDPVKVLHRIESYKGTFDLIRNGMRAAVEVGTAKRASVRGLSICGKTGSPSTAKFNEYRHAWFVGFAPYDKPEIAVVVFSEWGHGGSDAAPIARKVFQAWQNSRYKGK